MGTQPGLNETAVFGVNLALSWAMLHVIFHLDTDALNASVEQRDDPREKAGTASCGDFDEGGPGFEHGRHVSE
jgi:hypothetical protein